MTAARTPFNLLPRATQAGIMCNDARFQAFAAKRAGAPEPFLPTAAAEWMRQFCKVASRRELDESPLAARRFEILKSEFDAFTGKISKPAS